MVHSELVGKVVFPGEFLGVIEEFIPGRGTYEENGNIYASKFGVVRYNAIDRVIYVSAFRRDKLPLPEEGDVVIGIVHDVKDEIAIIRIDLIENKDRPSSYISGFLHLSQVSMGRRFNSMYEALRVGDIVRAKVLNSWNPYQLSIKGSGFGVIFARCSRCLSPLIKRRGRLFCRICRAYESRKIASGYGGWGVEESG